MERVIEIIKAVEKAGDKALLKYTKKFDGVKLNPENLEVNRKEWMKNAETLPADLYGILKQAADNVRSYAEKQNIYKDYELENNAFNIKDKFIPVESVGIYVPGGEYSYPSTVLMCAIPAKVAGVKKIVMATPCKRLTPAVFAAADIAGVDRIFRIGGPQAIAALALGTEKVPRVEKIVGPGNKYVQKAKQFLSDRVGIDMIAGPSEVVIIADEFQKPSWIAADLMAQVEHASDAKAVLISFSERLIGDVRNLVYKEFDKRIEYIKVDTIEEAAAKSNQLAPEHLQLMCHQGISKDIEVRIRNAGAVFIGETTPVALGDYWAGPSHTLPTGRCSRFQEGLNVRSFLKKVSFITCPNRNIDKIAEQVEKFASEEGMKYHTESVKKRRQEK